jgi:hypothetical protein
MTQRAAGSFTVSMNPAVPPERAGRTTLGRMELVKQYEGELAATGKGEMLTAVTDTKGSASYVAIEQVSGVLLGRSGSFVVHHAGTMAGGVSQLSVAIVADSGTDQLTGIAGTMTLEAADGGHRYELLYTLPQ